MSFALSAVQAAETDGLLLWMVFDDYDAPQVDDCGVYKYIDELVSRSPDGYKVNGARLRVAGTDTYLGISEDGAGAKPYANGLLTIAPDPETGYFTKAGPVWTDLGAYATTEYSFLVELGNWTEDGEWIVMAASAAASSRTASTSTASDIARSISSIALTSRKCRLKARRTGSLSNGVPSRISTARTSCR